MNILDFKNSNNYVLRITVGGKELTITKEPNRQQSYINCTNTGLFLGIVTYHNTFLNCYSTTTYGVPHTANIDYDKIIVISHTEIQF